MSETWTPEAPVGTVTSLDDHRRPVRLVKDNAVPAPAELGPPQPIEGTVIPAEREPTTSAVVRSARAVRTVATHDRTRRAARLAVRHGSYVLGGAKVVTRRAWDSRTTAVHQRMIKAAETAGDHAAASEWQDKADRFRQARHARRMALITGAPQMAKSAAIGVGVVEGALLGIGTAMAVADHNVSEVIAPTMGAVEFIHTVAVLVGVLWGPAVALAPWLAALGLWAVGKRRGVAPAWTMPAVEGEKRDVVPDEGAILDALRHLGIAPLNRAVKDGWQPRWVSPTVRLGNGWHTQLQLPLGVTVEMVNGKKDVLAHNLLRLPVEVWPTEPANQPGVLDLWVADQGSLSGKVPAWPLLSDGTADYFKGVPVGVSQRGEPVGGKLMAANYMVGGIMGSGKSSLVVSLLLGAMLDPLVEIEVYVMAYNVDYDPMRPRLRTLVKGDEDEQVEAALKALRGLRDEVTLRGKLLDEMGGDEVRLTRAIAERDPRMRPKVVVFDECFPAGTMVGGKPIESLKPGDIVPSWDESTGLPCDGIVKALMRKVPDSLVRIHWDNGTSLVCTPNHPLMTRNGWCAAGDLTPDSEVLTYGQTQAADNGSVLNMRDRVHTLGGPARVLAEVGPGDLLAGVLHEGPCAGSAGSAAVGAGAAVPLPSHDGEQPDARPADQGARVGQAEGDRTPAAAARGQRPGANGTAASAGGSAGLADGGHRSDGTEEAWGASVALQAGHRKPGTENRGRSGRQLPFLAGAPGAGPAENCVAHWRGVDRVEVLEPGSDGRYGGLCPDGHVYNFEVADTHVYRVADGVVAHNCHELFEHKKYGPEAAELAVKVMKKARKVGITLIWVTVSPTAASIPKDVTRNTSHRVAFAVGDHVANDGLLGTGKHRTGITATTLNPAENVGTALTVGFTKNAFELIRSYYVRKDSQVDQISPVVARALALREGISPAAQAAPAGVPVDHLADIAQVLGDDARRRTDEVRQLLAERNPSEYRGWTASDLTQALEAAGAAPYKSGGLMVVSRARVLEALAERDDDTADSNAE